MKKTFLALGIIVVIGLVIVGFFMLSNKTNQINTKVYHYVGTKEDDRTDEGKLPDSALKGKPPIYIEDVSFDLSLITLEDEKYNNAQCSFTNLSDKNIEDFRITYKLPDGEDYTIGGVPESIKILKNGESTMVSLPLKKEYTPDMLTLEKLMIDLGDNGKKIALDYDYNTQTYTWLEKN